MTRLEMKLLLMKKCILIKYGKIGIDNKEELKTYIINIYKTMLLRAIKGTYIYVCDRDLKEYLSSYIVKYIK